MPATVLSIDDNPDDFMLLRLACEAAGVSFRLEWAESGEEAIAYLEGAHGYADRDNFPLPNLILLDLKMPGISGFELLPWIRQHRDWSLLPVVVFTSSIHAEDRARALKLGANHFLIKPVNYEALQQLVQMIDQLLAATGPLNLGALQDLGSQQAGLEGY